MICDVSVIAVFMLVASCLGCSYCPGSPYSINLTKTHSSPVGSFFMRPDCRGLTYLTIYISLFVLAEYGPEIKLKLFMGVVRSFLSYSFLPVSCVMLMLVPDLQLLVPVETVSIEEIVVCWCKCRQAMY